MLDQDLNVPGDGYAKGWGSVIFGKKDNQSPPREKDQKFSTS